MTHPESERKPELGFLLLLFPLCPLRFLLLLLRLAFRGPLPHGLHAAIVRIEGETPVAAVECLIEPLDRDKRHRRAVERLHRLWIRHQRFRTVAQH